MQVSGVCLISGPVSNSFFQAFPFLGLILASWVKPTGHSVLNIVKLYNNDLVFKHIIAFLPVRLNMLSTIPVDKVIFILYLKKKSLSIIQQTNYLILFLTYRKLRSVNRGSPLKL